MLRIFIGTSPGKDDADAERVLEHTLRKNSSEPLEIIYMRNTDDPDNFFGGFDNEYWWTPFSFLRWAIPEYCGFQGRALYMDVDQVNFRDIAELYNMDLEGKAAAIKPGGRTCVMLMDCERMQKVVPPVDVIKQFPEQIHGQLSKMILENSVEYDDRWNCLDGESYAAHEIHHLHFTDMQTQPWEPQWTYDTWAKKGHKYVPKKHPRPDLVYIWKYLLEEANDAT